MAEASVSCRKSLAVVEKVNREAPCSFELLNGRGLENTFHASSPNSDVQESRGFSPNDSARMKRRLVGIAFAISLGWGIPRGPHELQSGGGMRPWKRQNA